MTTHKNNKYKQANKLNISQHPSLHALKIDVFYVYVLTTMIYVYPLFFPFLFVLFFFVFSEFYAIASYDIDPAQCTSYGALQTLSLCSFQIQTKDQTGRLPISHRHRAFLQN